MNKSQQQAVKVASLLAKHTKLEPVEVQRFVEAVFKKAKSIDRLNVIWCNSGLSERQESRRDRLVDDVHELCKPHGLIATINGDPRGVPIKLRFPENEGNDDFGGDGVCIY